MGKFPPTHEHLFGKFVYHHDKMYKKILKTDHKNKVA